MNMKTKSKPHKFVHGERINHKFRGLGRFVYYRRYSDSSCVVTFDNNPTDYQEVTLGLISSAPKLEGIHKL